MRCATVFSAEENASAACSFSRRIERRADRLTRARLAAAIEVVHAYSLVHDDLPCMDDDDMRRGRATVHRVFGVEVATAAGVAMVPLAAGAAVRSAAETRIVEDTRAPSGRGVDARFGRGRNDRRSAARPRGRGSAARAGGARANSSRQDRRTDPRIGRAGRISGGASPGELEALGRFGDAIGLAFQIADDVLDVTATTDRLGKPAGRDLDLHKSTYPALLGIAGATERARPSLPTGARRSERRGLLSTGTRCAGALCHRAGVVSCRQLS